MVVRDLLAGRVAHDVDQAPVVHALRPVFRIPNDLVDEVTQMENEPEAIGLGRALIFVDHPSIGVLRALVYILTADECEPHRAVIVVRRRGDGATDTTSGPGFIRKAVPVLARSEEH